MSSNINLSSFPGDRIQGLAMLYTQNQDLKGKTPSEIAKIYVSAYHEIKSCIRSLDNEFKN